LKRSGFSVQGVSVEEPKAAGVTAFDEHVGSTAQGLKRSGFSVQGFSAEELKALAALPSICTSAPLRRD
jgi:hypothetical protein